MDVTISNLRDLKTQDIIKNTFNEVSNGGRNERFFLMENTDTVIFAIHLRLLVYKITCVCGQIISLDFLGTGWTKFVFWPSQDKPSYFVNL